VSRKKCLYLTLALLSPLACESSTRSPVEPNLLVPSVFQDRAGVRHYVGNAGLAEAAKEVQAQIAVLESRLVDPAQNTPLLRIQIRELREHLSRLRPYQPGLSLASSDLDFVPWSTFSDVVQWSGNSIRYAIRTTTTETATLQHSGYFIVNGSFAGQINSIPITDITVYSPVTNSGEDWCSSTGLTTASAESTHNASNAEVQLSIITGDQLECGSVNLAECSIDSPGGGSGECTFGSGGTGEYYFPGTPSGGQRVYWQTGEGTGNPSICGQEAIVQYVCIDVYVNGAWREYSCGFATVC